MITLTEIKELPAVFEGIFRQLCLRFKAILLSTDIFQFGKISQLNKNTMIPQSEIQNFPA